MRHQNHRPKNSNRKDSGLALLVVVWIMVMLAVLTISLSRRVSIELALTRHRIAELRADALAWAGLVYGMDLIREDTQDKDSVQWDTIAACGIKPGSGQTPRDIFRGVALATGYFDVGKFYNQEGPGSGGPIYGLQDEERKINLNAVTQRTKEILNQLLIVLGVSGEEAKMIAASVVDWHDEDEKPTDPPYGAESAEYEGASPPYRCKNRPFENVQELLFVKGMSPEIFSKMKDYVTVFPLKTTDLRINLATSSEIVIRAVARSVADSSGNTEPEDADSLARKIVVFRKGPDGREGTADDRFIRMDDLALNARERTLFLMMSPLTTEVSHYFRIRVRGVEKISSIESIIEAVIERNSLSIANWREGQDI